MSAVGIAFSNFRRGLFFFCIRFLDFLNKLLSYDKGAPTPILKALSERRGDRFQKISARKTLARDFRISK